MVRFLTCTRTQWIRVYESVGLFAAVVNVLLFDALRNLEIGRGIFFASVGHDVAFIAGMAILGASVHTLAMHVRCLR
jgi:hypothetical protein